MSLKKLIDLDGLSRFKEKILALIPSLYAGSNSAGGPATVANGIHYAQVNSNSTSTVFTATIEGITSYYDGLTVLLKNGVVTSASGFTININNLGAKPVYNNMAAAGRETTIFNVNYTLLLVYDEDRVDGGCWICYRGYYSDSNYVPTGYCTTAAATAAKSATCTYGYRDDDNYFPCLFRYANTAANATLAIASYATTAAPIYVNGARTSSSNTFGRGVILFLYHNNAYYCYNDGRFPILVDGAVTSVQEYVAAKYTKPSDGIPKIDLASDVQTSLGKADTALQSHQSLKTVNGNSLVGTGDITIGSPVSMTDAEVEAAFTSGWGGNEFVLDAGDYVIHGSIISVTTDGTYGSNSGVATSAFEGDTVTVMTGSDWYPMFSRKDTGAAITTVTVTTNVYSFVMPGADVLLYLFYDD